MTDNLLTIVCESGIEYVFIVHVFFRRHNFIIIIIIV